MKFTNFRPLDPVGILLPLIYVFAQPLTSTENLRQQLKDSVNELSTKER